MLLSLSVKGFGYFATRQMFMLSDNLSHIFLVQSIKGGTESLGTNRLGGITQCDVTTDCLSLLFFFLLSNDKRGLFFPS